MNYYRIYPVYHGIYMITHDKMRIINKKHGNAVVHVLLVFCLENVLTYKESFTGARTDYIFFVAGKRIDAISGCSDKMYR